jgi:hypothetical protein
MPTQNEAAYRPTGLLAVGPRAGGAVCGTRRVAWAEVMGVVVVVVSSSAAGRSERTAPPLVDSVSSASSAEGGGEAVEKRRREGGGRVGVRVWRRARRCGGGPLRGRTGTGTGTGTVAAEVPAAAVARRVRRVEVFILGLGE